LERSIHPEAVYGVRTAIDGKIIDMWEVRTTGFLEEPLFSPMDVVMVAEILVTLGTAVVGSKLVTSLVRKAAKKLEARALSKATKKALAKLERELIVSASDVVVDTAKIQAKRSGRALTLQEFENLINRRLDQNPWLSNLREAGRLSGEARTEAIFNVLKEMRRSTGKDFAVVVEGTGGEVGQFFEGGVGWALHRNGQRPFLAIEEQLLENPDLLYKEVVHDIAFDLTQEGARGMPNLGTTPVSAMMALERAIIEGRPPVIASLRDLAGV
jgi:hypothetical protein